MWKNIKRKVSTVDVLFAAGSVLISVGVGLWACAAAGLVVAGASCLVASLLVDLGGKDGEGKA